MTYPDPFPSGQLIVPDRSIKEEAAEPQPKRVILGQIEGCGMAISAPIRWQSCGRLRWRKKDETFVLEESVSNQYMEVPFVP